MSHTTMPQSLLTGCVLAVIAATSSGFLLHVTGYKIDKYCGAVKYLPDEKSCCDERLHDIPETSHAQCCGDQAYWRNESKPDDCTQQCGTGRRHPTTEICCNNRVVWVGPRDDKRCCGTTVYDGKTHECCGNATPFPRGSKFKCCGLQDVEGSSLYHNATMDCEFTSRDVTLKPKQRFRGGKLCGRRLLKWDAGRSLPRVVNGSHQHIRGWTERCMTKIIRRKMNGTRHDLVLLSLTPFFTGTPLPKDCADSDTVHVIVKTNRCRSSVEKLQDYFRGVTLDIFFSNDFKCRQGVPTLRLKERYNALILLSQHSNTILAKSLGFDANTASHPNDV